MRMYSLLRTRCGISLGLTAIVLGHGLPALAQETDGAAESGFALGEITVNAEPEVAPVATHPGPNQTRLGSDILESEFSGASLSTVLNSIAGVSTETQAGNPAVAVSIRGLQNDGRVAVTIDGAPQNFAKSGHAANSAFFADPEMLRSVDVVRGPAGTNAAAGAIGGTLALRTIDAEDLLDHGETQGGEARLRFGTLLERPTMHAAWATRIGENDDLVFAATTVEESDYTAPDDTDVLAHEETLSLLVKYAHRFGGGQKLTFGVKSLGSDYETGYESTPRRNRLDSLSSTLEFTGSAGAWHTLDATLSHTDTRIAQRQIDSDGHTIGPRRWYETETTGLRATAARDAFLGSIEHRLTFVLDGYQDVVTVDDPAAAGGSLTAPGTRKLWSVLAEDAIQLSDRTEAVLGLRFDTYNLTSDEGEIDGQQVSPSLILRHTRGPLTFHAILAQAFRPPTLSEALVNGEHPEPANFDIRPNPNLVPEHATTFELGATMDMFDVVRPSDRLTGRIAVFRNEVDDYIAIEEVVISLFNRYYQYQNVDHVRLEGVELELGYELEQVFARLNGQITDSVNIDTGEPVSGVAPDRYVLTAGWRNPDRTLEIGGRYTKVAERYDDLFSSEAWHTVDLFLNRSLWSGGTLNIALNNITNETYTAYLSTQPAPGFNAQASLIWEF
ncbi:TonB-dependent receptor domain-containing protein [Tropicimonas marinistellae]|uniref:TonB-dependent receptor domain-containing protein n=1 Tax=Tropicimonas marinistellae TaxID=1739787 RepID=UPI000831D6C7|nr:TonB-dependent receptor [Tropicimonas marinistellae]